MQGNIPGSQRHKELLQQALQTFKRSAAYRQAMAAATGPASRIDAALQSTSIESPEDQHTLEEVTRLYLCIGEEEHSSELRESSFCSPDLLPQ